MSEPIKLSNSDSATTTPTGKKNGKTNVANTDPTRFNGEGVSFKGKIIGWEAVPESRGEKMCHVSMAKLKAVVVAMKEHKRPISVNVSLEGIKLIDDKTQEIVHTHPINEISFIYRDTGDARAFGYIHRPEENRHEFFAIKTEKAAENVVSTLRDLFQAVYALQKKDSTGEEKEASKDEAATDEANNNNAENELKAEKEKTAETRPSTQEAPPAPTKSNPSDDLFQLDEVKPAEQPSTAAQSNAWLMQAFASSGFGGYPPPQPGAPMVMSNAGSYAPQQTPIMTSQMHQQQIFYSQAQAGNQGPVWSPGNNAPHPQMYANGFPPRTGSPMSTAASLNASTINQTSKTFQTSQVATTQSAVNWSTFGNQSSDPFGSDPFSSNGPTPTLEAAKPISVNQSSANDPFSDLANLNISKASPSTGVQQSVKKRITKEDFSKEPVKPTLLDLSQQQLQQKNRQPSPQPGAVPPEPAVDPFGTSSVSSSVVASNDFGAKSQSSSLLNNNTHASFNHQFTYTSNNVTTGPSSAQVSSSPRVLAPPPPVMKRRSEKEHAAGKPTTRKPSTPGAKTPGFYDPWAFPISPKVQQTSTNPFGSDDPFA